MLCDDLEASGFNLRQMDALEAFARKGDWHTMAYADRVRSLTVWEIDPQHNDDLRRNLPKATVLNVDSVEFANEIQNRARFDLVVLDNPQGLYGPDDAYCEHFDILMPAATMLRRGGVLVLNVNVHPYDYERQITWQRRREAFWGLADASHLDIDAIPEVYRTLFANAGMSTVQARYYQRNEFIYYLVIEFGGRGIKDHVP